MRRYLFPATIAIILISVVSYFLLRQDKAEINYRFAAVEQGSIVSVVNAIGTVKPEATIAVLPLVAGEVIDVLVDPNTQVTAGQPLARLRSDAVQSRLEQAKADLDIARSQVSIVEGQLESARRQADSSRASLEAVRTDADRNQSAMIDAQRDLKIKQSLAATGDVAPVETERALSAYNAASNAVSGARARQAAQASSLAALQAQTKVFGAQLNNALATVAGRESALRQAQSDYDRLTLRSPIDGVVTEKLIVTGQSIQAQVPAFTIVNDLSRIQVMANVDESEITKVGPGQIATFSFDAYPGEQFNGKIVSVRKSPQNYQNVVTFPVVIEASNPERKIFPGMTASARIVIDRRENVIKVPRAALRFRPQNGGTARPAATNQDVVYDVGGSGQLQMHSLRTGISDGVFVEMVEGDLKPGQQLVVGIIENSDGGKGSVKVGPLKF